MVEATTAVRACSTMVEHFVIWDTGGINLCIQYSTSDTATLYTASFKVGQTYDAQLSVLVSWIQGVRPRLTCSSCYCTSAAMPSIQQETKVLKVVVVVSHVGGYSTTEDQARPSAVLENVSRTMMKLCICIYICFDSSHGTTSTSTETCPTESFR